jgi:hypothetical protein
MGSGMVHPRGIISEEIGRSNLPRIAAECEKQNGNEEYRKNTKRKNNLISAGCWVVLPRGEEPKLAPVLRRTYVDGPRVLLSINGKLPEQPEASLVKSSCFPAIS